MHKITIPTNESYTGIVAGVAFVNGEAKTDDKWKADWFLENNYEVNEIKEENNDKSEDKSKDHNTEGKSADSKKK